MVFDISKVSSYAKISWSSILPSRIGLVSSFGSLLAPLPKYLFINLKRGLICEITTFQFTEYSIPNNWFRLTTNTKLHSLTEHLTLSVSHEDATSLLTETLAPPPFSADTYLSKVTDFNCTSVPSYISMSTDELTETTMRTQKSKRNFWKKLTSISPLGMPSKSEGLIQPSTTNHPPKFTALTLESPCNPTTWINQ